MAGDKKPDGEPVDASGGARRSAGWLVQKAGTMSAVQASGAALTFGLHVLIARRFGSELYGVFAHAVALSGFLALLAPLGWNNAIVRFVSQFRHDRAWELLLGAWRTCARTTFTVSLVASAVLVASAAVLGVNRELRASLLLSAALVPLMAGLEVTRRSMQGLGRFATSVVPEQVLLPLLALAGVAMLAPPAAARYLLPGYAAAAAAVFAFAWMQLARTFPAPARQVTPVSRGRAWHLTALPMLGSSFGYLVLNRLDVVLLGVMVSMADVGSYSAARRFVMLGSFTLASLNSVSAPALAAFSHQRDYVEFRRLMRRVRWISCLIGFPVFSLLLFFPGLFLGIFDLDEPAARLVLRILAVGQIVNVATGPVGTAMAMSGHERPQAVICGVAAGLAIVTMPFAVSMWGLPGAASVTATAIALQNVMMLLALRRYLRPHREGAPA